MRVLEAVVVVCVSIVAGAACESTAARDAGPLQGDGEAPDAREIPANDTGSGTDSDSGSAPGPDAGPDVDRDAGPASIDSGSRVATPVYFTFVSHNERTLTRFDYVRATRAGYEAFRGNLLRLVDLLARHGAPLSYQTDYVVLDGVARYEAAVLAADPTPTGGRALFDYLTAERGLSLEAHAHECITGVGGGCGDMPYNYADVVAQIRAVTGITPPPIIGGTSGIERPLDDWTACIRGNVFPETWCPEVLTRYVHRPGHCRDGCDDHLSGAWQPSALTPEGFGVHDPDGTLVCLGSAYSFSTALGGGGDGDTQPVESVRELLGMIDSGEISPGRLVTSSLMISEDRIDDSYLAALEGIVVELEELARGGRVVFATHPQIVAAWRAGGAVPSIIAHGNRL